MIELLGGKAGVMCGRFHYGSAFGEPSGHADKVSTIRWVHNVHKYKALYVIFLTLLRVIVAFIGLLGQSISYSSTLRF